MNSTLCPAQPGESPAPQAALLDRYYEQDFCQTLAPPEPYQNSGGRPLWGYDERNLSMAALRYGSQVAHGRYDAALQALPQLRATLEIDSLALLMLSRVFPPPLWTRFGRPIADGRPRTPLQQLILRLYEAFSRERAAAQGAPRTAGEIEELLDRADEDGLRNWRLLAPDEDHPTHAQLSRYYNSLIFPQGDLLPKLAESRLSVAYRAIPVALAIQSRAQRSFDYGGGSGFTTSGLAAAGLQEVLLIEENQTMLDFARWRDQQCGISNVRYLRESGLIAALSEHRGRYDIGVCTEVLEHVIDVEETIQRLADLVRPGGYLFLSASFGMYPHLSHLKQNVKYARREDELMAAVGFTPAKISLPIPMLSTTRLYTRNP